ncbi:MAG: alkyl sulfatase dimerization domain-containing protein [Bryobacteraceae bacterium]
MAGLVRLTAIVLAGVSICNGADAPATDATRAAQQHVLQNYPFADRQDFEDAKRGLIEALPGDVIHDAAGQVVWDLRPFLAFEGEDQPAPDSVNPALWRHAQLNNINGLFEVIPGIYQARGFDVAVATFIRGKLGWIVVDPMTSEEGARTALELLFKHEGKLPVTAVIYTHGHADHYLGAGGVIDAADAAQRHVPILAPEGFLEGLFSESVLAGNAMGRRFQFQSGLGIPVGPAGTVDFGQGKVPGARGHGGLIAPTLFINAQNSSQVLDGTQFVFQRTDGAESPGEMNFWLPSYRALCMSEVVNHGLHNIVTPRGAQARDALAWAKYIDAARERWGDQAQVLFATHRWPVWGKDRVIGLLEDHRDLYKYLHDQTVHLANLGYGPAEIAERIQLPAAISKNWSNHGYYGSFKLGSRGVYQRYLGFYDGNPANLDPLPPADLARRYVDAMGGGDAILAKAQAAYDAGDYRWVAELLKQLVFADPANAGARDLQAKAFEQLGYQAESALWRNIYLRGAKELREWTPEHKAGSGGRWVTAKALHLYATADVLDYLAVRVDGPRAATADLSIGVELSDTGEKLDLHLARGVLNYEFRPPRRTPPLTVHTTRAVLDALFSGELGLEEARGRGQARLEGDVAAWTAFTALLDDFSPDFPVVTRPLSP